MLSKNEHSNFKSQLGNFIHSECLDESGIPKQIHTVLWPCNRAGKCLRVVCGVEVTPQSRALINTSQPCPVLITVSQSTVCDRTVNPEVVGHGGRDDSRYSVSLAL